MSLKEDYINDILDGADVDTLYHMAVDYLQLTLPDDDEKMKQICFDNLADHLVKDEYIDGNGRRRKFGECAVCGVSLPQAIDRFDTTDGRIVCPSCAEHTT